MLAPGLSHQVLTKVLRTYAFVKLKSYMVNQLQNSKCGRHRHANSRTPHLASPRSARLPWVASPGHASSWPPLGNSLRRICIIVDLEIVGEQDGEQVGEPVSWRDSVAPPVMPMQTPPLPPVLLERSAELTSQLASANELHAAQGDEASREALRQALVNVLADIKRCGEHSKDEAGNYMDAGERLTKQGDVDRKLVTAATAAVRERQDKLALLATLQEQEAQLRQELALHQGTQLAHEQDVAAGVTQQHAVREGEKQARRHLAGMAGAYRQVAEELKVLKQEEAAAAEAARRKRLRETPAPWADADRQCVMCLDATKTHIFVPCGHLCVCADCSNDGGTCPICRQQSTSVIKAFVS